MQILDYVRGGSHFTYRVISDNQPNLSNQPQFLMSSSITYQTVVTSFEGGNRELIVHLVLCTMF